MNLIEGSPLVFVVITVGLGGGAAWLTGRAVALSWSPVWLAVLYSILLGWSVRFLHYALFEGTLLNLRFFAVDFAVVTLIALLAYRRTRMRQMTTQYAWLYEERGPLFWHRRGQ